MSIFDQGVAPLCPRVQVMAAYCWASDLISLFADRLQLALGVTCFRNRLLGAKTPWNRVKFTLGFGTSEASLDIKSSGSKMTCMDALMPQAQDAQERPHVLFHHCRPF
jgi:hypothetical protein